MEIRKAYFYFKILVVFIVALVVEFPLTGVYYRLVRERDFLTVDVISVSTSIGLFYWLCRKLLQTAWREHILFKTIMVCFLIFCILGTCFFRFTIQLANGFLDRSVPEIRVVVVTSKDTSVFGGSFKEGPSPLAHLIYFQDWDNPAGSCELLVPPSVYYFAGSENPLELAVRRGFFHLPWVEDFQLLKSHQKTS